MRFAITGTDARFLLFNAVYQQKRMPVRNNFLDFLNT